MATFACELSHPGSIIGSLLKSLRDHLPSVSQKAPNYDAADYPTLNWMKTVGAVAF